MLTKQDLESIEKAVKKIVRQELKLELEPLSDRLESRIILAKGEIRNEIGKLEDRIKNMEIDLLEMKKDIKILRKEVARLRKDIDTAIDLFDQGEVRLRKRVDKIEKHLNVS